MRLLMKFHFRHRAFILSSSARRIFPDQLVILEGQAHERSSRTYRPQQDFLTIVKDMTPSAELERWPNEEFGLGAAHFEDRARLIPLGVDEGWAANEEIDGRYYRRSCIVDPSAETFHFSITAIYINIRAPRAFSDVEDCDVLRGQYGQLNLVVALDDGAELRGLQGGQGLVGPLPTQEADNIWR